MPRQSRLVCVSCAVLALLAPAVLAAEAQTSAEAEKAANVFESLFGADVARVTKTRGAEDDIDLAKHLLATARGDAAGKPALVTVLCEKAFDLASGHAEGYATAVEAAAFLASEVPAKAGECAERLVTVRQKQYALAAPDAKAAAGEALVDALLGAADAKSGAGDAAGAVSVCRRAEGIARAVKSDRLAAVAARREVFAHRLTVHREIANMKALVARDSGNTAAREKLVRLYLVDLDDPAAAAKHLEGVGDESLKKYVPAAGKGVEAAPELASNQLGDWYRGLGEGAQGGAKAAMFARAKAYYDRFLSLHKADDLDRTAATVALKRVEAELAKLAPAAAAPSTGKPTPVGTAAVAKSGVIKPGTWTDLLALVDPTKDAVKGTWKCQGSVLAAVSAILNGRITMPVMPYGSYQFEFTFVRTAGEGGICVLLPVGDSSVMLALGGWNNTVSGLDLVQGKLANNNPTTVTPGGLKTGRTYKVSVRILLREDRADIAVTLGGTPLTKWSGPQSALSVRPVWALRNRRCLGLGAHGSPAVFRNIRLKMLSGEAKLLRPQGGTTAPSTAKPTTAAQPPTGPTIKPGKWTDLLALVDPEKDAVAGAWQRRGATVVVAQPAKPAKLAVPVVPQGDYELEVRFIRLTDASAVAAIVPVGSAAVSVVFGAKGGKWHGLEFVEGGGTDANSTARPAGNIQNGREYVLHTVVRVQGEEARIAVGLDGKPLTVWRGPTSSLSVYSPWALPGSDRFGLVTEGVVVWRSVRLKMLSGEARLLRPPGGT